MAFYDLLFGVPFAIGLLVLAATLVFRGSDADGTQGYAGTAASGERTRGDLGARGVPGSIVAVLALIFFGGTGLALAPATVASFGPKLGTVVALGAAALVSLFGTRALARAIARHLPSIDTDVPSKAELVGQEGKALVRLRSDEVIARVIDRGGAELHVRCRVVGGLVRAGDPIVVLSYDPKLNLCVAEKLT